jgi:recombination protein RecT
MAKDNAELSLKLSNAGASLKPMGLFEDLRQWFSKALPSLSELCGTDEAKKIFATARVQLAKSPDLLQCTKVSLQNCILQSMALKLYPGPMQECAYVKFGDEAVFMPMYQGITKLAIQGKTIRSVKANVVYERDEFDYSEGTEPYIKHRRYLGNDGERGARVAFYATATVRNGAREFVIMSLAEVEAIRSRSRSAKSSHSPWNTDFDEMGKKTVLKRMLKLLPKSTELAEAIEMDNALERPDLVKAQIIPLDDSGMIDVETTVDEQTELTTG